LGSCCAVCKGTVERCAAFSLFRKSPPASTGTPLFLLRGQAGMLLLLHPGPIPGVEASSLFPFSKDVLLPFHFCNVRECVMRTSSPSLPRGVSQFYPAIENAADSSGAELDRFTLACPFEAGLLIRFPALRLVRFVRRPGRSLLCLV